MDQLKQPSQSHGFSPQSSSNLTAGTNGADDWQEETYQNLKQMKEQYFAELSEWYQKIATKLQQHGSLPNQPKSIQLEKLRMFKTMLERLLAILQFPKNNITLALKDKMALYETWIMEFIETSRPRKPVSSPNNPPQPEMLSAHVLQLPKVEQQESNDSETMDTSGANWQEEIYQKHSQPYLSQTQHPTIQMQHLSLQESHQLLQDMQQRLQPLYTIHHNQSYQSQGSLRGTSTKSPALTRHTYLQEVAYEKIKVMKQLYLPKLSDMYWKAVNKLQQEDSSEQQLTPGQHANLSMLKSILERVIPVLHFSKADISVGFMDMLVSLEKHILTLINTINPDIL